MIIFAIANYQNFVLGRNACPEGWIAYNDICYQFNLDASQKMTWPNAEAACNAIGNFASLAKINSQREQDLINKRIQTIANGGVWIGLNDIKKENVFRWSADDSQLGKSKSYQIWVNGKYPSENQENRDCVMMQSVRKDGAWTVQNCSQAQNFVCMRHRGNYFETTRISYSQFYLRLSVCIVLPTVIMIFKKCQLPIKEL